MDKDGKLSLVVKCGCHCTSLRTQTYFRLSLVPPKTGDKRQPETRLRSQATIVTKQMKILTMAIKK